MRPRRRSFSVVRRLRCTLPRGRPASQREQMIANGPNLGLSIPAELRVERLRMVRPERRHPCPRHDTRWGPEPVEDKVRLQPIVRHPKVGREIRHFLISRNRAEHVTLLAFQELEELFAVVRPLDAPTTS